VTEDELVGAELTAATDAARLAVLEKRTTAAVEHFAAVVRLRDKQLSLLQAAAGVPPREWEQAAVRLAEARIIEALFTIVAVRESAFAPADRLRRRGAPPPPERGAP